MWGGHGAGQLLGQPVDGKPECACGPGPAVSGLTHPPQRRVRQSQPGNEASGGRTGAFQDAITRRPSPGPQELLSSSREGGDLGVNTLSALKGVRQHPSCWGDTGKKSQDSWDSLRAFCSVNYIRERPISRDLTRMWNPMRTIKKQTRLRQVTDTENGLMVARLGVEGL